MIKVLTVLLLMFAPVAAAQAQPESARAVADSFFAATNTARWQRAAGFLDMDAFARFLRMRVRVARTDLPQPSFTAEDLMARDSTLPRAVAEWQVEQNRRFANRRPFHDFSDEFIGITSFPALEALTPADGAARWLEAQDPGARWRRTIDSLKCPEADRNRLRDWAPFAHSVLGAVEVSETTAYALTTIAAYTRDVEPDDRVPPSTVQLRRREGVWRIVPTHSLLSGTGIGFGNVECAHAKPR